MPNYNFVAGSYHTNKLSSRLSSSEVRFYTKTAFFRFFAFCSNQLSRMNYERDGQCLDSFLLRYVTYAQHKMTVNYR